MPRAAEAFERMTAEARSRLLAEGFAAESLAFACSIDMRYRGQAFEIAIPLAAGDLDPAALLQRFHEVYASMYGHANMDQETELVNLRLVATARTLKPVIRQPTPPEEALIGRRDVYFERLCEAVPIYDRELLAPEVAFTGPAIVEESGATTVVFPGWMFRRDAHDNLRLSRTA